MAIDISSHDHPELSNFNEYPFILDGVTCRSMEGFLQSLKVIDETVEESLCMMIGHTAKRLGKPYNDQWERAGQLYWRGVLYWRHGLGYQQLLDRAFNALALNPEFHTHLMATGSQFLYHSIGKNDPSATVLTEAEFCFRLMLMREHSKASRC